MKAEQINEYLEFYDMCDYVKIDIRLEESQSEKSNVSKEEICQAHMAGQRDAGCLEPSYSNAIAYYTNLKKK